MDSPQRSVSERFSLLRDPDINDQAAFSHFREVCERCARYRAVRDRDHAVVDRQKCRVYKTDRLDRSLTCRCADIIPDLKRF